LQDYRRTTSQWWTKGRDRVTFALYRAPVHAIASASIGATIKADARTGGMTAIHPPEADHDPVRIRRSQYRQNSR